MCRVAIINRKGGTGKTTTAINLATALAQRLDGARILLVDWDSQRNATISLGMQDLFYNDSALFKVAPLDHIGVSNLDLMGASQFLGAVEEDGVKCGLGWQVLHQGLLGLEAEYAFVIIDCPPSLSWLSLNALAAASKVLVPMQAEYLSVCGLVQLVQILELLKLKNFNPVLHGVLFTMFDGRTKLARSIFEEVRNNFQCTIFRNVIPRSISIAEASLHRQPGILYKQSARAADAYRKFVDEFLISL